MKLDDLNKGNVSECNFPIELLSAYIDNELNENERQKVEEHLKFCPNCLKVVEEFKTIDMGLRQIEIEEPSSDFIFNLNKKVMEKIRKKRSPLFWKFIPVMVPVAVVTILVIIISGHENLVSPVSIKNRIDIVLVPPEKLKQTDKIDVVIPRPSIAEKIPAPAPVALRKPKERKLSAGKDVDFVSEKTEIPALEVEAVKKESIAPVVVRAVIDSTGRVLNVATGNTITPQEDTIIYRMLKDQRFAPPKIRGKPTQMVVEFVTEEKDTSEIK